MLKQLKKDIKERNIIYTAQEIDNIYNRLKPLTQVTEEEKNQHIENIDNKIERQTKEHSNKIMDNLDNATDENIDACNMEEDNLLGTVSKLLAKETKEVVGFDNNKGLKCYKNLHT